MTTDPDDTDGPDLGPDHPGGYDLDDIFTAPMPGDGIDGDTVKE